MDTKVVRLGKRPKRFDRRTLSLSRYLSPGLPAPPERMDNSRSHVSDWGMMLNDVYSCCAIAAVGHATQSWVLSEVNPGIPAKLIAPSDGLILGYYERWAGYNPADASTDQGAYVLDVLNHWRKDTFAHYELKAYAEVNPLNPDRVRQSLYLFGGLYIGFQLPISSKDQEIWDCVGGLEGEKGSWGGHAVWLLDYDQHGLNCVTWGVRQRMTWKFFQAYCDEAYALLSDKWRPPDGFDWHILESDLALVTR